MDTVKILSELRGERARLDKAISALEGINNNHAEKPRRRLSAAARKRISEAAKARWAAVKGKKK